MSKTFRTDIGQNVFIQKYALTPDQTWSELAYAVARDVTSSLISADTVGEIGNFISKMKFIPAGRYLYYGVREASFYNNCFVGKSKEDTREQWAQVAHSACSVLMSGGGYGNDYSVFRPAGAPLARTGGEASGPIPLMAMVNEIGRNVMQGGSRRSALYASLNWQHGDAHDFLKAKDWHSMPVLDGNISMAKEKDFNYPAPLDMTNISLNYDDAFIAAIKDGTLPELFVQNTRQAMMTGEPGFSFNFGAQQDETGRNPCCEIVSSDDNDVCNLGSVNMAEIETLAEFADAVRLGTIFLLCGTIKGELPLDSIKETRAKNRRLGLGILGVHEWLLKRGYRYEMNAELKLWLQVYEDVSRATADEWAMKLSVSTPIACRAIAPTGSIGLIAGTTTGIEPLFAVAYKRRYLSGSKNWKYEYVIDGTAKILIDRYGLDPDDIESASDLALHPRRRIKFQAEVQGYVDQAISSTLNLPAWGTDHNNEDLVHDFAETIAEFAPRLRGLTCYPDGARGGQPLTIVPYKEAIGKEGMVYVDEDPCNGGVCGI